MSGYADKLAQIEERAQFFGSHSGLVTLPADDVLALVEIAKAARTIESWQPSTEMALDELHPQEREAILALRAALAAQDDEDKS